MTTSVYLRISQDRDDEREGVERQRADCAALIERNGWTLGEAYVDNDSSAWSKSSKRPEYRRMLADAAAGRFERVVVWKLDRLTRGGVRGIAEVLAVFERSGVDLVSVTEVLDTSNAMGEAVIALTASMAKQSSDDTSLRVKRAQRAKFDRGEWIGGGARKFGFTADRSAHVPEEVRAIRWAVKRLLDGGTLYECAANWNSRDLHRKDWRSSQVRQGLASLAISGRMEMQGEVTRAPWKPIVSAEDHDRLLNMIESNKKGPIGPRTVKHLLTGLVKCTCGAFLTANPDPRYSGGVRYRCPEYAGSGHVTASGQLETEVEQRFLAMIDRPEFTEMLREAARRHREGVSGDAHAARELGVIDRKLDEVREAYSNGRFDLDEMLKLRETLLERRRSVAKASPVPGANQIDLGALQGATAAWEAADIQTKRRILKATCDISLLPGKAGRAFDPDRVVVTLKEGLF